MAAMLAVAPPQDDVARKASDTIRAYFISSLTSLNVIACFVNDL